MKQLKQYFFQADHWIENNKELLLKILFGVWVVLTVYLAWTVLK